MTRLFEHQIVADEGIIVYAFRYALGRMSYSVDEVATAIEQNADVISIKMKSLMVREISHAIINDNAGMQMDIDRWELCRKYLQQSIAKQEAIDKTERL